MKQGHEAKVCARTVGINVGHSKCGTMGTEGVENRWRSGGILRVSTGISAHAVGSITTGDIRPEATVSGKYAGEDFGLQGIG